MRWRHEIDTVISDEADEPVGDDEVLSTISFASWPDEAINARAARGLATRCDPAKVRCRLTEKCRLCGAAP